MRVSIGHVAVLHLVGKNLWHLPGHHSLSTGLIPVEVEFWHRIIESEYLRGRRGALRMVDYLIREQHLAK